MLLKNVLILSILALSITSYGRQEFTNTLSLAEGISSPKADLTVINWLAGHWHGEAFGGKTEEIWGEPLGGSMMGSFKLVVEGKVVFYEIVTIDEESESLILRLKHFNADLTGWEAKEETVDFRLVKVTPGKIYFDEFTIEKISDDEINIYVVIENKGTRSEERFNYIRVRK